MQKLRQLLITCHLSKAISCHLFGTITKKFNFFHREKRKSRPCHQISPQLINTIDGPQEPGCEEPKRLNSAMSDRRGTRNESASNSSNGRDNSNRRRVVSNHLPNLRSQSENRPEESIFVVNPMQINNFMVRPPFWHYGQYHNYSLVYPNHPQAVFHQQLTISQNCFHRPNQESQQRHAHRVTNNVGAKSIHDLRFWEKISNNGKPGFVFTVMSYNVLAQDLVQQHPHLYTFHNQESLKWDVRWRNLMAEIRHFSPDILCLQEVQGSHLNSYFSPHLETLGYKGLYKQRTGVRTDGCAIYYKHNLVHLVEHETVEYNQPNIPMLDRDNVAIIAKFAPRKHPNKEFVLATTHLLYNPRRQDVRLAQTQLLLTEVDRIAFDTKKQYVPTILTGDLNSTPESPTYKFITKGKITYEHLSTRSLENGVNGPKTGKVFLPKSLRITDQCQHADLLPKRKGNATLPRSEEVKLIELKHSERDDGQTKNEKKSYSDENLFNSGTLTHKFALRSVYDHRSNGDVEGTTFQDEWVSVDYIFFSERHENKDLVLLERYRLPTKSELGNVKIPNTNLGSDHLSLLAKFQLKV